MNPNTPTDDPATLAALYVSGAIDHTAAAEFESRLDSGDAAFQQEYARLSPVLEAVLREPASVPPSAGLRERLLAQVSSLPQHSSLPQGFFVQTAREGVWNETGSPGVRVRTLFQDQTRGVRTLLLRMDAGALFNEHPHEGVEECYVIEGDITIGSREYLSGDYMRAESGTTHEPSFTCKGCLLLLTSPL